MELSPGVRHDGERFIEPTITNVRLNRIEMVRLHLGATNATVRYSCTGTHSDYGEVRFDLLVKGAVENLHQDF